MCSNSDLPARKMKSIAETGCVIRKWKTLVEDWNLLMKRKSYGMLMAVGLLTCTLVGCGTQAPPTTTAAETGATPPAGEAADSTLVLVNLKAADLLDGTEDKVVGKCYVCALGMDGKPEHSAEVEGYTCHLCSGPCKEFFEESAESVIAETKIPSAE